MPTPLEAEGAGELPSELAPHRLYEALAVIEELLQQPLPREDWDVADDGEGR
jgi:hypothetical protein